jgi:hypothetical protein
MLSLQGLQGRLAGHGPEGIKLARSSSRKQWGTEANQSRPNLSFLECAGGIFEPLNGMRQIRSTGQHWLYAIMNPLPISRPL